MSKLIYACEVTVDCDGHEHRISLTDDGAIHLHDHTEEEKKANAAADALGLKWPMACWRVLRDWRDFDYGKKDKSGLPPELLKRRILIAGYALKLAAKAWSGEELKLDKRVVKLPTGKLALVPQFTINAVVWIDEIDGPLPGK